MENPAAPMPWLLRSLWQAQDQGGQAYTVAVYKYAPCPCGNTPASPNNITCVACGGTGLLYPRPARTTHAVIHTITLHTQLLAQGLAQPGDVLCSTEPGAVHLDPFDLCRIAWGPGIPVTGQVVVRGTGPSDPLPYPVETIEGVWTVDPTTGIVTPYTTPTDWRPLPQGVAWVGRAPAAGTQYTVRYSAAFDWVVFDPPDQRVAFGRDLGQRAILRKRYLVLPDAPTLQEG